MMEDVLGVTGVNTTEDGLAPIEGELHASGGTLSLGMGEGCGTTAGAEDDMLTSGCRSCRVSTAEDIFFLLQTDFGIFLNN